jgi:predicted CXXCH cytochrome family protein
MILSAPLLQSATFTGPKACAVCHPVQSQRHAASMHQRALRPAVTSHAVALFDRPVRDRSGLEFSYGVTPQGLSVEARRGSKMTTAVLEWMFGAGTLAFTPVGRYNGKYFEHRVSWYSASQRPGMTLGHPAESPVQVDAALGQVQSSETIFRCFNCHATAVKPGPELSDMQPGVQCERCHGPGSEHVSQPGKGNILKLSGLSAKDSIQKCAECHRTPSASVNPAPPEVQDPLSIRFAPLGLMASKCFLVSGAIKCVTCHDPHGGPRPAQMDYENKCRGCHAPASHFQSNCLECHMRKFTPVPDLTFTDHRIRIYPAALKN